MGPMRGGAPRARSLRLLVVLGSLPAVLAACGGSSTPASKPTTTTAAATKAKTALTISVTSVVSARTEKDTPPAGTSRGDTVHFRDRLLNAVPQFGRAADEQVGTDRGTMTFTGPHTARLEGEAVLPDGKIIFRGKMTPVSRTSVTVPIVGGTGKYENATGTLVVGAGLKRAPNTYRLLLEGRSAPVA